MNKQEVIRMACGKLKNTVKMVQWYVFFGQEKKAIKKNLRFKNAQKEDRCFVLGNGPSLNEYDLSLLQNEFVFCVNDFIRFDKVSLVKPNAYVMADPKFFDLDKSNDGDRDFIEKIRNLKTINEKIEMFVPIDAKEAIEKYGWNLGFSVNYFKANLCFESFNKNKMVTLEKPIPAMQAVVQYAVLIAMYMGFEQIYLLGTEQTNIFGNIRSFMNKDSISDYAFTLSNEERAWKHEKLTSYTLQQTLRGYARIFELFDELYDYCDKQRVKLYNCSTETLIQGIPKLDYYSVFESRRH